MKSGILVLLGVVLLGSIVGWPAGALVDTPSAFVPMMFEEVAPSFPPEPIDIPHALPYQKSHIEGYWAPVGYASPIYFIQVKGEDQIVVRVCWLDVGNE